MAKNIKDIMNEVSELNLKIKQILHHSDFENYDDLSGLDIDRTNAEELFLTDELYGILDRLSDISHTLNYLDRPVKAEGRLHKNSNGRYELNGHEFSSGCGIEYLADDDRHMTYDESDEYVSVPYWCSSRIEHDGNDYYIVGASKDLELEGLQVRYR